MAQIRVIQCAQITLNLRDGTIKIDERSLVVAQERILSRHLDLLVQTDQKGAVTLGTAHGGLVSREAGISLLRPDNPLPAAGGSIQQRCSPSVERTAPESYP
eukprot:scaffold17687_cov126-Isochrysis_galbana.AAC.3